LVVRRLPARGLPAFTVLAAGAGSCTGLVATLLRLLLVPVLLLLRL
jgi:hypothetical protein